MFGLISQLRLKGYYKIALQEAPSIFKTSNFDMIIIHIGILIYPVKDSAERGIVFSKYSFVVVVVVVVFVF